MSFIETLTAIARGDTVSPTACLRCDVFSELCCPGAKPQRWIPPLVTPSAQYRQYNKDLTDLTYKLGVTRTMTQEKRTNSIVSDMDLAVPRYSKVTDSA